MNIFDSIVHANLQSEINQDRAAGLRTEQKTIELQARVMALEKSTRALWALIKDKTGWTDEELMAHAQAVEAVQAPRTCPSCGRRLLTHHGTNCSWCGRPLGDTPSIVNPEGKI